MHVGQLQPLIETVDQCQPVLGAGHFLPDSQLLEGALSGGTPASRRPRMLVHRLSPSAL
jgi:hypothetical protein